MTVVLDGTELPPVASLGSRGERRTIFDGSLTAR